MLTMPFVMLIFRSSTAAGCRGGTSFCPGIDGRSFHRRREHGAGTVTQSRIFVIRDKFGNLQQPKLPEPAPQCDTQYQMTTRLDCRRHPEMSTSRSQFVQARVCATGSFLLRNRQLTAVSLHKPHAIQIWSFEPQTACFKAGHDRSLSYVS